MAHDIVDDAHIASAPFEGPEKLLELWFTPLTTDISPQTQHTYKKVGLRAVPRDVWEEMLDIVQCKVLSMIEGSEVDAYLLSESSFFVFPHRLILKTCGTTLNLLGLPRILEIAAAHAGLTSVHRCFYSRKSFMFPDRQLGPHRDWKEEVQYLDNIFDNGAAYTVGKVNGDHWLLYMTDPDEQQPHPQNPISPQQPSFLYHRALENDGMEDYTIEILMSDLAPASRDHFFFNEESRDECPSNLAQDLSAKLGITNIFPPHLTTLDAFAFTPCGYSSNALIKWGDNPISSQLLDDDESPADSGTSTPIPSSGGGGGGSGEGYYTIHVTPESGWSYASFECNVPLVARKPDTPGPDELPDLVSLIRRVVSIFQPGRLTMTLFISSRDNDPDFAGESPVEAAQRAFKIALMVPSASRRTSVINGNGQKTASADNRGTLPVYRRSDKINYEFGGYDLAFASFELER